MIVPRLPLPIVRLGLILMCMAGLARIAGAQQLATTSKYKGVSWVASHHPIDSKSFDELAALGVEWIVQTPFGWQEAHDKPEFRIVTADHVHWGETDVGLVGTTRLARTKGIRTVLKPHIWLRRSRDGSTEGAWRGEIAMTNEEDWERWFELYSEFITHYARLAEANDIELLCIGTELHQTAVQRPENWRRIIREIRSVYSGELTYAANWHREFEEIEFWDELDYIGIQAYFPLSEEASPSAASIETGWSLALKTIERVQSRFQKPVLFTEVGYKSTADGLVRPWEWHATTEAATHEAGLDTQALAYEVFFTTVWQRPWMAGAFWWKWFAADHSARDAFSPQGKPAEDVLGRWYRQKH